MVAGALRARSRATDGAHRHLSRRAAARRPSSRYSSRNGTRTRAAVARVHGPRADCCGDLEPPLATGLRVAALAPRPSRHGPRATALVPRPSCHGPRASCHGPRAAGARCSPPRAYSTRRADDGRASMRRILEGLSATSWVARSFAHPTSLLLCMPPCGRCIVRTRPHTPPRGGCARRLSHAHSHALLDAPRARALTCWLVVDAPPRPGSASSSLHARSHALLDSPRGRLFACLLVCG